MWDNRENYTGISVLPYDGGTYKQTPFEDCTKEVYDKMMATLKDVDLSKILNSIYDNPFKPSGLEYDNSKKVWLREMCFPFASWSDMMDPSKKGYVDSKDVR